MDTFRGWSNDVPEFWQLSRLWRSYDLSPDVILRICLYPFEPGMCHLETSWMLCQRLRDKQLALVLRKGANCWCEQVVCLILRPPHLPAVRCSDRSWIPPVRGNRLERFDQRDLVSTLFPSAAFFTLSTQIIWWHTVATKHRGSKQGPVKNNTVKVTVRRFE